VGRQGEIFLAQGKYTVDVLKRFGMMDCNSMSTPMVTNLRKLHDSDTGSDLVDPTMYRQLIGSLMYMIHTRPDICYAVIAMSQFITELRQGHLGGSKAHLQISQRNHYLWSKIYIYWWFISAWV
jgi:hypothetical protein